MMHAYQPQHTLNLLHIIFRNAHKFYNEISQKLPFKKQFEMLLQAIAWYMYQ